MFSNLLNFLCLFKPLIMPKDKTDYLIIKNFLKVDFCDFGYVV